MAQHPVTGLSVQSSSEERRTGVQSCVEKLMAEGRTREQAQSMCIDQADKAMGTREARRQ